MDHSAIVLVYMDLDQFNVINDTCGHLAGDELLRHIALLLPQALRKADVLAGSEAMSSDFCYATVRRGRRGRSPANFWKQSDLSLCLGETHIQGDIEHRSGDQLARPVAAKMLSAADAACYLAKDQGRNRIHLFDDSDYSGPHAFFMPEAKMIRHIPCFNTLRATINHARKKSF